MFDILLEKYKSKKKVPLILAPMESITDLAFRELSEEFGAVWTVSEMVSADALIRNRIDRIKYMKGNLKFNVVQLFSNNTNTFKKAAIILENSKEVDALDINLGCPSPRLTNNLMGSKLLDYPNKIYKIVYELKSSVKLPISAKIRLGFKNYNYENVAKALVKAGIDLITIHGRLTKEGFSGKANWEIIYKIKKEHKNILIIGNGDIKSNSDLNKLKNLDGLMIGRSAIGNPSIFREIYNSDYNKNNYKRNLNKQKRLFIRYLKRCYSLNYLTKKKIFLQTNYFFKDFENSKIIRNKINDYINNICNSKEINNLHLEKIIKYISNLNN